MRIRISEHNKTVLIYIFRENRVIRKKKSEKKEKAKHEIKIKRKLCTN